jgi:signal transduction histidine kinase
MGVVRGIYLFLRQPSLLRRLLVAQLVITLALWVTLTALIWYGSDEEDERAELKSMHAGATAVFSFSRMLHRRPDELTTALSNFDLLQRVVYNNRAPEDMIRFPGFTLSIDGRTVYTSPNTPEEVKHAVAGVVKLQLVNGHRWSTYAEDSTIDGQIHRFAAIAPASAEAFGFAPWSFTWFLLPLMVSLPLIAVPAWISIRIALRPWSRFSEEIHQRNALDMSELKGGSQHRELITLTDAMNSWLARLRASRERERRFVADAAHELRTPVAAVQIHADALRDRLSAPQDKELIDGLLKSNARATHMVNQLLGAARSEVTTLNPMRSIDFIGLVQESIARLSPMAQRSGVDIELEGPDKAELTAEAEALELLVDNLIGNAVKYSPRGSIVQARIDESNEGIALHVIDAGPGIPEEWRERVFERFVRVPGSSASGGGLGLSIVKTVAQQHGAAITLMDTQPHGLHVRVVFAKR